MYIDADAHVDENPDTWSYIPKSLAQMRPAEVEIAADQVPHLHGNRAEAGVGGWLVDGRILSRAQRDDEQTQTTADIRHLRDIPGRLRHMDELGIETQVLFPTMLVAEVTDRAEVELALCESYNRWIADRCSESNGRLRWVAVLPNLSIPDALKEMRRVKKAGAVGITKRPMECDRRRAGTEYFHPLYEQAQELDLAYNMHIGQPFLGYSGFLTVTRQVMKGEFYMEDAFISIVMSKTYEKFPRLRFGFIEAGAGWLPSVLHIAKWNDAHRGGGSVTDALPALSPTRWKDFLEETNLFVTVDATEDIQDLLSKVGDSNLMVGTDYGHSDRSSVLYGHRDVAERSHLSKATAIKLTETNARRLYGLPAAA